VVGDERRGVGVKREDTDPTEERRPLALRVREGVRVGVLSSEETEEGGGGRERSLDGERDMRDACRDRRWAFSSSSVFPTAATRLRST
jgi:hypothetical protein